jgi:CheY-like chemotaxis protein
MHMGKTVLLIDDDKDDLEMLQQALSEINMDYKIIEAHDGIQGLNILRELVNKKELPCLIVLDINMPRKDGRQTLLEIKSDKILSNIPIVIFSTSSSPLDKAFFEKYNTAYFVKPINFDELKKTASRMIDICSMD